MRATVGRAHRCAVTIQPTSIDAVAERLVADIAATAHAATVVLGDRLGLYRALAEGGAQTPTELADRTACRARLVEEWLNAQAASAYVEYDATVGTYAISPEVATCLVDESSPAFLMPYVLIATSMHKDEQCVAQTFTGAAEHGWGDHHHDLYAAFTRATAVDYADLVTTWIPALDGVERRLQAGARVADVGCGDGAPTLLLAAAFPRSTFAGFDIDQRAIERARKAAAGAGSSDRVTFETIGADALPGEGYDLVCTFDALHDMADPVAVARRVREVLAPDGTWMIVDRNAGDRVEDNLHVGGRLTYSASTFICVPGVLAQGGEEALGAQAGEARLRQVALDGGFTAVRRAAATPFNLVLEARR
jgi:SAM-dependent methyltransferase